MSTTSNLLLQLTQKESYRDRLCVVVILPAGECSGPRSGAFQKRFAPTGGRNFFTIKIFNGNFGLITPLNNLKSYYSKYS